MKDNIEFEIDEDGTIRTIHQEGIESFAADMGGDISTSCRASNVEWEEVQDKKGWTVRSAYDNELALRETIRGDIVCSRDQDEQVYVFNTREKAIELELKFFWELLAPRNQK